MDKVNIRSSKKDKKLLAKEPIENLIQTLSICWYTLSPNVKMVLPNIEKVRQLENLKIFI